MDTRALLDDRSVDELEKLEATEKLPKLIEERIRGQRRFPDDTEITVFEPEGLDAYLDERRTAGMEESPAERQLRIASIPPADEERAAELVELTSAQAAHEAWDAEVIRRMEANPSEVVTVKHRFWRSRAATRNIQTPTNLAAEIQRWGEVNAQMRAEGWTPSSDDA